MSFPQKKITICDGAVFVSVLILFIASCFFFFRQDQSADHFTVRTPDSVTTYSLREDRVFFVESCGITLQITVDGGSVSVTESSCPDKICVTTGKISSVGQSVVCIPARVVIRIIGEEDEGHEDFIVG